MQAQPPASSRNAKMKVDIIIPTYEQAAHTVRCMQSVQKHTEGLYRVVWLDNGSSEESREEVMPACASLPSHRVVWAGENLGFLRGMNLALRLLFDVWRTDADYIVMLNNDVEVTPRWLSRMVGILEADEEFHAIGPVTSECKSWQSYQNASQVVKNFQIPAGLQGMDTAERAKTLEYAYADLHNPCWMLAFFCTVFRREVFDRLGYLDERFGIGYGDDDDFCKRLNDANMRCCLSMGTYVFHNHQTTFKSLYTDEEIAEMKAERLRTFQDKHGEAAHV